MQKLRVNAIQCTNCFDIIFSRARHDWRACSCYKNEVGNKGCYIDGGFEPAYSVGGENPKSLTLELTNVSKSVLYADWNKKKDKYGLYKNDKLPKYIKIIDTIKEKRLKGWKELREKLESVEIKFPKHEVHVDLANGPDKSVFYLQVLCNEYPDCNAGYLCPIHDPEGFKSYWDNLSRTSYSQSIQMYYQDTLDKLRQANLERSNEWDKGNPPLSYYGNEMSGEAGEACNIIKKIDRELYGMVGSKATLEQLGEELSDVLICIDRIAMKAGIDLKTALPKKFNKTSEEYGLKTRMIV